MASRMRSITSSSDFAWVWQPGRAGADATKYPAGSFSMRMSNCRAMAVSKTDYKPIGPGREGRPPETAKVGLHSGRNSVSLAWKTLGVTAAEKRRLRRLGRFGADILAARGEARAHAHVAWLSLAGFAYLSAQWAALGWLVLPTLALYGALCLISLYDARYFIIPNCPIGVLAICGAFAFLANDADDLFARLAAAGAAYMAMRLVAAGYERLRGEAGLGEGDAKLLAIAGWWLGYEGLPGCLLVAVLSALASAAFVARDQPLGLRQPIPFGPHLALGLWLAWAIGPLEFG